jgi:hypothetical protein
MIPEQTANSTQSPSNYPLKEFIINNPESEVNEEKDAFIINKPWGDESIKLIINKNLTDFIKLLTTVRFPPGFTALWHKDTNDIEFIFTYLPENEPLRQRKFTFTFDSQTFQCEFSNASETLHEIICVAHPVFSNSGTDHRNLVSLGALKKSIEEEMPTDIAQSLILTSFYIRHATIEETNLAELATYMNFYMRYFDTVSPRIIIHDDPSGNAKPKKLPSERFPFGEFPTEITCHSLDSYLLTLWESALDTDSIRRFLNSYQILEYTSFYFIRDEIKRKIHQKLASPELVLKQDEICDEVLDLLSEDRSSDEQKISLIIQRVLDPCLLWKKIQPQISEFSQEINFDGGFTLPPFIKNDSTLEDFNLIWYPKLPDALKNLRNGLTHAREMRQSRCIAPTKGNEEKLRPWADLILDIGTQVILYEPI